MRTLPARRLSPNKIKYNSIHFTLRDLVLSRNIFYVNIIFLSNHKKNYRDVRFRQHPYDMDSVVG